MPIYGGTTCDQCNGLCKIQALLDRISDRAHIIETGSESYRLRRTVEKRKGRTPAAAPSSAPSSAERKASELYMVERVSNADRARCAPARIP